MDGQLPGFRFSPTEEELVSFYIPNKLKGMRNLDGIIPVVDIYDHSPWDLPQLAGELCPADSEQWFFFTLRQEREARGGRPNRLTSDGYWKATGSPGPVYSSQNSVIGRKKTMVFYVGRAPHGIKTIWKMHEYHHSNEASSALANPQLREEVSLCRIYTGSRNIRVFDRRPAARGDQAVVHHQFHGNDAAAFNYEHHPLIVLETSDTSLQSLETDENNINPCQSAVHHQHQDNPEIITDNSPSSAAQNPSQLLENGITTDITEPYWDSDLSNWFYIWQQVHVCKDF